mmetsp:Transcript_17550/g.26417  ORF Transcript_17550/g.26417 Transcript_17550/m.26417 type:complete len:154 (-) Transcript_17550:1616-2077(-)
METAVSTANQYINTKNLETVCADLVRMAILVTDEERDTVVDGNDVPVTNLDDVKNLLDANNWIVNVVIPVTNPLYAGFLGVSGDGTQYQQEGSSENYAISDDIFDVNSFDSLDQYPGDNDEYNGGSGNGTNGNVTYAPLAFNYRGVVVSPGTC